MIFFLCHSVSFGLICLGFIPSRYFMHCPSFYALIL